MFFDNPIVVHLQAGILLALCSTTYPNFVDDPSENYYQDGSKKEQFTFLNSRKDPTKTFSIIIPAYNEEERCECFNLFVIG